MRLPLNLLVLIYTVSASADLSSVSTNGLDALLDDVLRAGDDYRTLWLSFVDAFTGPDKDFLEKKSKMLKAATETYTRMNIAHDELMKFVKSLDISIPPLHRNYLRDLTKAILSEAFADSLERVYALTIIHGIPWSVSEYKSEVFDPVKALQFSQQALANPPFLTPRRPRWWKRSLVAAGLLLTAVAYRYHPHLFNLT